MHYPLISAGFLSGYRELLAAQGVAASPLFDQVGLDPQLMSQPDTLIPFDRHNQLLLLAAKALRCPHFGLTLARQQGLFIFGPLATLSQNCHTVGDALNLFSKHLALVVQTVTVHLRQQDELVHLGIDSRFEQVARTATFQDHALALACDMVRSFCGAQWRPRAVYFPRPAPEDIGPYSAFFRCAIGFNHGHLGLVLDHQLLRQPLHRDVHQLPHTLRQSLEQRHHYDLLAQLREVIAATLATETCNLTGIARAIGYSPRTLQRRLNQLNTSFAALLNGVRCRQATSYLSTPYYRLTDVAAMLGYSELSAFTRSFKRHYGVSPQRWRQRQLAAATAAASAHH